ncbi:MAG: PAS domain-containing protein [Anaerolineae bacterium]|nr:PAS domain-containing protein [Anaerolineae bacterium]
MKKNQHDDNEETFPGEIPETTEPETEPTRPFSIVGLGASAGGLEALKQFFAHMPHDSNIAFVVVQHLDPDHQSYLSELIQPLTQMAVVVIEQGVDIVPNRVYVVPPGRNVELVQSKLQLSKQERYSGMGADLPIDFFFRSLAYAQGNRAICIILSGMGTDGTLGLKLIKEQNGLVMAQSPESAQNKGMPNSAIATGLVDYILPPDEMPAKLINYTTLAFTLMDRKIMPEGLNAADYIERVLALLRAQTGHDFSLYKRNMIDRRIQRRMAINQSQDLVAYVQYLQQTPDEREALFKDLLIGVTEFFRDPETFEVFEQVVLPHLFENRTPDQAIRVWVPGCATGEEAYSIAMLIQKHMKMRDQVFDVQIFATDIDEEALNKARVGLYPGGISANVPPEYLRTFFVEEDHSYRIVKQIRDRVIFAAQNVIKDPPFSKLDLISCRNLLIYLGATLQQKVLSLFHYALNSSGFLFLGTSENLGKLDYLFDPVDTKAKLFKRAATNITRVPDMTFVTSDWASKDIVRIVASDTPADILALIDRMLLENYAPACVVVNERHEIVSIRGRTGRYLELTTERRANLDILAMARTGLQTSLGHALHTVMATKQEVVHESVQIKQNGETHIINLIVKPIGFPDSSERNLIAVIFQDVPISLGAPNDSELTSDQSYVDRRIVELEQELTATKDYLQATIEELRSANEEAQSANEEMHSVNEELETSQEELKAVNEELVTVNAELRNKVRELTWANSDLDHVLANMEMGLILLDIRMHIRRFNPAATKVINLIETDINRPLGHVSSNLIDAHLVEDVQSVLDTLETQDFEVQSHTGDWYRVRIKPYRTENNVITGAAIMFTDITAQHQRTQAIEDARRFVESVVDTVREPLVVLDEDLRVVFANATFYKTFHVKSENTVGALLYDLGNRQWDIPRLRELLEEIVPQNTFFEGFEVRHDFPGIGSKRMYLNARKVKANDEGLHFILLAIEDITSG